MAADWIKMRSNLATDPDVVDIASRVAMDEFAVVGRLHVLWSWADQHSCDGILPRATSAFLDRLTACPGFAEALRQVGWLEGRDSALRLPNWDRHNGSTAKARSRDATRQQAVRNSRELEIISMEGGGCVRDAELKARARRSSIRESLRKQVYGRDDFRCAYCGLQRGTKIPHLGFVAISLDHVIPLVQGGETEDWNLVTACLECNLKKTGRTPTEAGMELAFLTEKAKTALSYVTNVVTKSGQEKRREEKRRSTDKPPEEPTSPPAAPAAGVREGKDSAMLPTTEQSRRFAAIMHRKPTTPWSPKEVASYKLIGTVPEDDLAALERYYAANWPPTRGVNHLRTDLLTLLNNLPGEIGRALISLEKPKTNGSAELHSRINPAIGW